MAKIDSEGLEQLAIVRNALDGMYDKLNKKGVYSTVQEEFQFIAGVVDDAKHKWEKVDDSNVSEPSVMVNGQEYKPIGE